MAFLDSKTWNANRQAIYYVTAGASDLPTTGDYFNISDWVVNLNPTMAVGDPVLWVVTSLGTGNNAPTFTAISYAGPRNLTTVTASTTLSTVYKTVLANASSAGFTITLPTVATANTGFNPTIIRVDSTPANPITVTPAGSNTILGLTGNYYLNSQYQILDLLSDGSSNWERYSTPPLSLRSVSAAATLTTSDRNVLVTAGATITMPSAATFPVGLPITVRNASAVNVTLAPAAGTIDGYTNLTVMPYNSATVLSDGSNYFNVGSGQGNNQTIRTVTLASTVATTDQILFITNAGTLTLPTASTWPPGYVVKMFCVGITTITPASGNISVSGQAAHGGATTSAYAVLQLTSDGTQYWQIG